MKKLIALIIIISAITVTLSGCSGPDVASSLSSQWQDYEKYTYSLEKNGEIIGSLTLESTRLKKQTLTIGGKTYEDMIGTKMVYELIINDSSDRIFSEVFFSTVFKPKYSYKEMNIEGRSTIISAEYTDKKYNYILNNTDNSMKISKTGIYDNEMIYYLLRSSDLSMKNYSFSFSTPSPEDGKVQSRTVTRTSSNTQLLIMDTTMECYELQMKLNQRISGSPFKIYYAKTGIEVGEITVLKPMVKIIEGEYIYTLTDISLSAE